MDRGHTNLSIFDTLLKDSDSITSNRKVWQEKCKTSQNMIRMR